MKNEKKNETGKMRLREYPSINFFYRLFKQKPLAAFGFVILVLLVLVAIFADVLAPYKMTGGILGSNLIDRLQRPSMKHILGTDTIGRDMLSYMIYGARTSVILAVCCTIISTVISVILGVTSATIGGWFDLILQRLVDAWQAIPSLLITLILMAMLGNGMLQLIFVLSVPAGIGGTRMIRSAAFTVKDNDYVKTSAMLGANKIWVMLKHIVPNIMPMILMALSGSIGGTIMAEATLNFLGYGVSANTPDWGSLLTDAGRSNMYVAPWLAIIPGVAIAIVVFASAMFSDGVRDILDPRLRGGASSYRSRRKNRKRDRGAGYDDTDVSNSSQTLDQANT